MANHTHNPCVACGTDMGPTADDFCELCLPEVADMMPAADADDWDDDREAIQEGDYRYYETPRLTPDQVRAMFEATDRAKLLKRGDK
jgi:hypothetical protein